MRLHRIAGIHGEVDNYLFELLRVGTHRAKLAVVADDDDGERKDALWERLVEGTRRTLAACAESEVTLCFEPEPGMFIERPAGFVELKERLRPLADHFAIPLDELLAEIIEMIGQSRLVLAKGGKRATTAGFWAQMRKQNPHWKHAQHTATLQSCLGDSVAFTTTKQGAEPKTDKKKKGMKKRQDLRNRKLH
jgi:hypothetical protein